MVGDVISKVLRHVGSESLHDFLAMPRDKNREMVSEKESQLLWPGEVQSCSTWRSAKAFAKR